MFVLFMVVLFVFVGLGVDLGFAYITKARLSKAVDSAALTGARSVGQGTISASAIAKTAFSANYGTSGRDVSPPVPSVVFSYDAANNLLLDVSATSAINTFFIRVLPTVLPGAPAGLWRTLTVGSVAQALRAKIVLSLVLDHSGSMKSNGGAAALPGAVANFIDLFYENYDRASMSSFSQYATADVPMRPDFKAPITTAAALPFPGSYTCTECGLTNGLAQNAPVVVAAGEKVIKAIVLFTDGMANTFTYKFNCGFRNIDYNDGLYNVTNGNSSSSGCTIPPNINSIDPKTGVITSGTVSTSGGSQCADLHNEAQNRAVRIAHLAREQGILVYAIGMGSPGSPGECGFPVLNPDFLKDVANTPDAPDYDSSTANQVNYAGDYAIAADSSQLDQVFQTIGEKILLRLTR